MSDRPPQPTDSAIITTNKSPILRTDGALLNLAGGLVQNHQTGMGLWGRDSSVATTIGLNQHVLTEYELRSLFRHNWLIRRVVTLPARDMVRAGVNLTIHDGDSEDVNAVLSLSRQLKVDRAFRHAEQWARLFGRSYIVIRVNGDEDLAKPLRPERVKSVDSLWVYDRYQLKPATDQWHYADPEFYQLTRLDSGNTILGRDGKALQFSQKIHKSRVLQFSGDELPPYDRHLNEGCDDSVIQKMFDAFRKYYAASGAINEAINSFSILTVSIAELTALAATKEGLESAKALIQEINLSKSLYGTLVTDANVAKTDFMGRSLGGVEGLFVTAIRDELTACSELPFYKLWGEIGRSGLTDSGSAESKYYSDLVAGWQEEDFREPHERLFAMLMQAALGRIPEDWEHSYNSIYTLPPKEEAEIAQINAQTYEKLAGIGVATTEEIRQAVGGEQSLASAINLDDGMPDEDEQDEDLSDDDAAEDDRSDSTDYHADDALWDEAVIAAWGEVRGDDESSNRLYYFQGRRTGIIASSAAAARKKMKRGGKKLVRVRALTASEKKIARRGGWVRSGKNGERPGYGGMRGKGPRPKSWRGDAGEYTEILTRDTATGQFILVSDDNTRILGNKDAEVFTIAENFDGFSVGSSVSWKWQSGTAHGKVVRMYKKPIELTIKGSTVKRNGSEDNPAVLVETIGGDRVLKLASELRKDEERNDAVRLSELPTVGSRVRLKGKLYTVNKPYRQGDRFVVLATRNGFVKLVQFSSADIDLNQDWNVHQPQYWANAFHSFGNSASIEEMPDSEQTIPDDSDRTDAEPIGISGSDAVLSEAEFESEAGAIDLLQVLENVFEDNG